MGCRGTVALAVPQGMLSVPRNGMPTFVTQLPGPFYLLEGLSASWTPHACWRGLLQCAASWSLPCVGLPCLPGVPAGPLLHLCFLPGTWHFERRLSCFLGIVVPHCHCYLPSSAFFHVVLFSNISVLVRHMIITLMPAYRSAAALTVWPLEWSCQSQTFG